MSKKVNEQASEWINVEKNTWMFLFPSFGLSSFCKCVWSHTSTRSQDLADGCSVPRLGAGPGCSAWWATELLPGGRVVLCAHNLTGPKSRSGHAVLHLTAVLLVADSPVVTTVMMALCPSCCRSAGRCWQSGRGLVESTWSVPSMFMFMASVESSES